MKATQVIQYVIVTLLAVIIAINAISSIISFTTFTKRCAVERRLKKVYAELQHKRDTMIHNLVE